MPHISGHSGVHSFGSVLIGQWLMVQSVHVRLEVLEKVGRGSADPLFRLNAVGLISGSQRLLEVQSVLEICCEE